MKTHILLLLGILACIIPLNTSAQDRMKDRMEEKREEINEVKKEYIGQRIHLKAEQEEAFWKKYDLYIEKKMRLKHQMAKIGRQNDNLTATDEQLNENIDKLFTLRQEELNLDKQSKNELLDIINVRQLAELYRSEKEFIRKLLQTLRGRGRSEGRGNREEEEE